LGLKGSALAWLGLGLALFCVVAGLRGLFASEETMAVSLSSLDTLLSVSVASPNREGLPCDMGDLRAAQVWTRRGTFIVSADFRNPSLLIVNVEAKAPVTKSVEKARDFWTCLHSASTTSWSCAGSFETSFKVTRSQSKVDSVRIARLRTTSVSASLATGIEGSGAPGLR